MNKQIQYIQLSVETTAHNAVFESLMYPYIAETNEHSPSPLPEAYHQKWIRSIIAMQGAADRHLELCYLGDTPIGFFYGKIDHEDHKGFIKPGYGYVMEFYIRPEYRRNGYGTIIFRRLEHLFKVDGATTMYLTADPITGKPFWEAMGFVNTNEKSPENQLYIYEKPISFQSGVNTMKLSLVIPNESHEAAYIEMITRWEASGDKIAPQLLSRYSGRLKQNVPYSKWLEWCEDDRTTGSSLSTNVPATLYFLMTDDGEILGSIVINHGNTKRGHMHAGIVPWKRNEGLGTILLQLALEKCREMGFERVELVPYKGNEGAVGVILKHGGVLLEEFYDDGDLSLRYAIDLS
jgi:predicted acetyltransferase